MSTRRTTQASHETRVVLHKSTSTRLVSLFLLALGLIALAFSIIYTSSILAFIGLGLTLWGTLTFSITTEKYVKQTLLDPTTIPSLANLNQILTELEYQGKPVYLPPKYLKESETIKVYIPKNKNTNLPKPEEIQQHEDETFIKNSEAALINPPGLALSELFEKTLGTTFTKVDLKHLQQNLQKLFIEDLEIAENLEMQTEPGEAAKNVTDSVSLVQFKKNTIHVKITNSIYKDICKDARNLSYICGSIGCPISSAIACAIAKASSKPVTIEKTECTKDGKIMEAYYRIVQEEQ